MYREGEGRGVSKEEGNSCERWCQREVRVCMRVSDCE